MPRFSRVVVPGVPHHVIQRGSRRQQVFFSDSDRALYLALLSSAAQSRGVLIWAYCLMSNHVHLVAVPSSPQALASAISEVHGAYSRHVNFRQGWRGYLWQGRFKSCPMDDTHAVAAIRYVERNPVRAGIVDRADQFCWSSAGAHCGKTVSPVLAPCPLVSEPAVWASFLEVPDLSPQALELEDNTRTGRPLGHASFVDRLEQELCRPLRPGRRGPKPRAVVEASGEVAAA